MLLNNRYRIIRTLGSGGFGETFLAEDTQMPSLRRCVIKQLKPITDNPQVSQLVQQRFQREAAILEELGDGNNQIPRLYAYFLENGQFYLVQEYIEGHTLTVKVQQQGLMTARAVKEILTSILPVLDYVHSKGIVHRDIKPDNIIIRHSDGKPILIDFGAVKETLGTVVSPSGKSNVSIVIGTPGFMPSEQSVGRPMFASDIYSLGLTAIYLLTGKIPQELGTDPATGAILWQQNTLSVTPSFAAVLDKAIQFSPSARFASARDMLQAIETEVLPVNPIVGSVPPTVPYTPSPIPTTPPTQTPPHTIPVNPGISSPPDNKGSGYSRNRGIFLGSLIAGGLIGASIIIGFALTRQQPQPLVAQPEQSINFSTQPSIEPETPQEVESPAPTIIPNDTPTNTVPNITETPPSIERLSPEEAVRNYYLAINQGAYQAAWNQLSPNFQNNKRLHPNGYLSYIDWWGGKVQSVDIQEVNLVQEGTDTATVETQLTYQLKTGKVVPGSVQFSLLWDVENNRWVIADAQ
jgi:serine/threonine-protein kinase